MGCCKSIFTSERPQRTQRPQENDGKKGGIPENDGKKGGTIYVENLPGKIPPYILREMFKKFGTIPRGKIRVVTEGANAYAFIEFESMRSVAKAVKASPLSLNGRLIYVEEKWSYEREKPVPTATEEPAPTTTENPAPTTTENPGPSTTEKPGPSTTKKPGPNTTEKPGPSTIKKPGPNTTEKPAPSTTKKPVPNTTEKPAPTTTEKPEPSSTKSDKTLRI